jgi:hypothetical protein
MTTIKCVTCPASPPRLYGDAASDLRSEGHFEASKRAFAPLETEWGQ